MTLNRFGRIMTRSFFRRSFGVLFLIVSSSTLFAQTSPKESGKITIGIHEQIAAASQYSMRVQSSVVTETDPYFVWQTNFTGLTTPVQSPNAVCSIFPGRLYTYWTGSNSMHIADVQFNIPPGYTIYLGWTGAPLAPRTSISSQDYQGGIGVASFSFYVVPNDGAARYAAGYCRAPHIPDITWAIGLGRLACGASAGSLRWQSQSLSQNLLDSSSLTLTSPEVTPIVSFANYLASGPVAGGTPTSYTAKMFPDQVSTYNDASGNLKYLATDQIQIYITRNTGTNTGYNIQVFNPGISFQWAGNNPANTWTFASLCSDQYTVAPGTGTDVAITRVDTVSGQTETWTLHQASGTTTLTETSSLQVITLTSTPISGGRKEVYQVADSTGTQVALLKNRTYTTFPWGEELVSEVADPNGLALTTNYTYYNTTAGDGHYSKLQSVTNPDGSWAVYNYYDDFARWGQLASVSTPWLNSPATSGLATASNCKVTNFSYTFQVYDNFYNSLQTQTTSAFQTLSAGSQTLINGTVVGQINISPSVATTSYNTPTFFNQAVRTDTIQNFSASGISQTTVKSVFHNTSDPIYNGKLYYQINPDGMQISASYWKGTLANWLTGSAWNSTTITPSSTSPQWVANYLTGTSTKQDPSAILYSTDGVTNGMPIVGVWMTPYKSFRKQTITDGYGNPWYEFNEVFTGSGFQMISWHQTGYSWDGLLVNDIDSTGGFLNNSYIDGHVNYATNADNTQTQYFFDALMRPLRSEFKAVAASGNLPALGALETYFTYDPAGNVTQKQVKSADGTLVLTTSAVFNKAGLITSSTDEANLITNYAYTNGGRTVTTTLPNGSTTIQDKYLDGHSASSTGTGQVNQFFTYNIDGTAGDQAYGMITATTSLGSSGSARWSSMQSDWLGRIINSAHPGFGGTTVSSQSVYNTLGQLTKSTQTGLAATLYQYDGLGQPLYTALDVNNNGVIDLGGTDRVTQTSSSIYVDASSNWWNRTVTSVFNVMNSATPAQVSDVRTKLIPFPSTNSTTHDNTNETDSYDAYGNLTTDVTIQGRSSTTVTRTVTHSNSSAPEVSVSYNGVPVSHQTAENITTTCGYDGLYRKTSEVDPRKGTSSIAYFASNNGEINKISSTTDAAGKTTSFTYNAIDGRLLSQTDPMGNITYHSFDHIGREIKTWGPATFPIEYAFDAYGAQIAMRTFRVSSPSFVTATWPLSDDGSDPQNPIPTSWATGDVTTWVFDAGTGFLASKTDAAGKSVAYTYTQLGKILKRTWARGVTATYTYDPNTGDPTVVTYSDTTPSVTTTYDRLGRAGTVVQAYSGFSLTSTLQHNLAGKLTLEAFDPTYFAGRQASWILDTSGSGTQGRTTGFDVGTTSSPGSDQNITYGYDGYGRFNSEGLSSGPSFAYGFTPNSNLISTVTDAGDSWTQTRGWEAHRDLLTSVQTSTGSTNQGAFAYVYDNDGRRSSKVATGAIFARYPAGGLSDIYSYDSKSEVTGSTTYQSTNLSTTTPMLGRNYSYAFDPIGNRTSTSIDAVSTTYNSNSLNQITNWSLPAYYSVSGLAPIGAGITVNGATVPAAQIQGQYYLQKVSVVNTASPSYNTAAVVSNLGGSSSPKAWMPLSPEVFSYDADGNILTDGRWHYWWDAENRLTAMETYGHQTGDTTAVWNSGVPLQHIDFKYDYKGRRISKALSTWSGSAFTLSIETRYVYSYWNLVADYTVSGAALTFAHSYLWGIDLSGNRHGAGGVGGLLAEVFLSGSVEIPVYDGNGNIIGLTDRSSKSLTAFYEYSPFGEILRETGFYAKLNAFRFSTKYIDDETSLTYYGQRYYNPGLGRFLGRDPIQEKGGTDLYAFVQNNSVNNWDFLGQLGNGTWRQDVDSTSVHYLVGGKNGSKIIGNIVDKDMSGGDVTSFGGAEISGLILGTSATSDAQQQTDIAAQKAADKAAAIQTVSTWVNNGFAAVDDPSVPAGTVKIGDLNNLGVVGGVPLAPAPVAQPGNQYYATDPSNYVDSSQGTNPQVTLNDIQSSLHRGTGDTLNAWSNIGNAAPVVAGAIAVLPAVAAAITPAIVIGASNITLLIYKYHEGIQKAIDSGWGAPGWDPSYWGVAGGVAGNVFPSFSPQQIKDNSILGAVNKPKS